MQSTHFFDLENQRLTRWEQLYEAAVSGDLTSAMNEMRALGDIERYWAYPGRETYEQLSSYLAENEHQSFQLLCGNLVSTLKEKRYRAKAFTPFHSNLNMLDKPQPGLLATHYANENKKKALKPYFEVLIVHPSPEEYEALYRNSLEKFITFHDNALYDVLFVDNYYDAIIAILSNSMIQACIYLEGFSTQRDESQTLLNAFEPFFQGVPGCSDDMVVALKKHVASLRPDIDQYYICSDYATPAQIAHFDHIISLQSPTLFADIHHQILSGLEQRYSTPFFDALRSYANKPKGAFHALPISQGQSIEASYWINDVADFYGEGIFAAETSSTLGGMDSIMDPRGSISQAQNKAARLFRSKQTYFVTNGTTAANKIVMQANLHPDDIVLASADCHKSIPYSVLLAGAKPIFLETYPLNQYDLYGCVTLKRIKEVLLDLKQQGELHRVKQITLTNATFDGIIYNVKRYMMDILAIKPDIIFHWDEAWFSFGYFNPLYHGKTAMDAANALTSMKIDAGYRKIYERWRLEADLDDDDYLLNNHLYPDPDSFIVRVYSTQSTHKTLTAFRQASMLHVHDTKFSEDDFYEAYRTHTSTSPNYQIIASLDFARRQMSLEGYELVRQSMLLAWELRHKIKSSTLLSKYFTVLDDQQLIPEEYLENPSSTSTSHLYYAELFNKFRQQLFSVDLTRITLDISATGIDGPNFRQMLMTQYDIQVNKTSHNTLLFIINIGTKANSIQYLFESLHHIAAKLGHARATPCTEKYVANLPLTRNYHDRFIDVRSRYKGGYQAVDIRCAYYAGFQEENVEYILLSTELLKQAMEELQLVSAGFVTPYPPGFPIIVPGQLITYDLLLYLQNIQIKEIHGYHSNKGLKVFRPDFLQG